MQNDQTPTEGNHSENQETEVALDGATCSALVAALARIETLENALRILMGDIDYLGHWIPDPCRDLVNNALASDLDKRQIWVQYSHEDEKTASVIQTADSEQEARNEDETVMSGCCWYRYDIAPGERDGKLINGDGPHYLTNAKRTCADD